MKMKPLRLLISGIAALTVLSMVALDLPIKNVNGRAYYYYEVKPKDDLYTICRNLGLTRTEVVRNNPSVVDGLRRGQMLYFPVEDAPTRSDQEIVHLVKKGETLYGIANLYGVSEESILGLNPGARGVLKAGMALVVPAQPDHENTTPHDTSLEVAKEAPSDAPDTTLNPEMESVASTPVPADLPGHEQPEENDSASVFGNDTIRITLMLPFMLKDPQPSKTAQLYTEFFKGFMLATDSLRNYGAPLVVTAVDTENSLDQVAKLLEMPQVVNSDLIVGPDDDTQLNAIAEFANTNGISLMNIFAVKNQAYLTNPSVLQANIPHSHMYRHAVDALMRDFSEFTPVFLQPVQGKCDKAEFQQILRSALTGAGKPFVDVTYTGVLKAEDLAPLDSTSRYLFVPSSGTTTEFNRIITALHSYKDGLEDMSLVHLFGYPEWITFRRDMLDKVHYMNSTIYSRFYNDSRSERSEALTQLFSSRYGTPMLNAIPLQGMLGFDSGMYVIKALNQNLHSDTSEFQTVYDGIQCDYRFINTDDTAGRINNTLYFITFRPSGFVDKRSL